MKKCLNFLKKVLMAQYDDENAHFDYRSGDSDIWFNMLLQLKPGFFDNRIFLTYFAVDCFFHVSTIEFPSGFFDTGFI